MNSLGLCEHCGIVLSVVDMPPESIDAIWLCPKCEKKLTHESFGYQQDGKKIKWVGPAGEWVNKEPVESFELGNFRAVSASEMRLMMNSRFSR